MFVALLATTLRSSLGFKTALVLRSKPDRRGADRAETAVKRPRLKTRGAAQRTETTILPV